MIGDLPIASALALPQSSSAKSGALQLRQWLQNTWAAFNLATRFAIAATVVIGLSMLVLCWWVSARIERGVTDYAIDRAALQFDAIVEPNIQALSADKVLPEAAMNALKGLLVQKAAIGKIIGVTIWSNDGTLVFNDASNDVEFQHSVPSDFDQAKSGALPQGLLNTVNGSHRLQISAPLHDAATGRVIAIARIVEDASDLASSIESIRVKTAAVVGLLSLAMLGLLFNTVRQGSRTIAEQRRALAERVETLSTLLQQNTDLHERLQEACRRRTDTNDRALRRIGAELHDGPVQLIALSLLRLENLRRPYAGNPQAPELEELDAVEGALRDALKEIRGLSAGLSLPNLENVPVARAIEFAVVNHERRSRTRVKLELAPTLPLNAEPPILACVYRLTQEALNNAVRHAGGKGQAVRANFENQILLIEISDKGPGFSERLGPDGEHGLGLIGLKDRIESIGGELQIVTGGGIGTKVIASIDIGAYRRREVASVGS